MAKGRQLFGHSVDKEVLQCSPQESVLGLYKGSHIAVDAALKVKDAEIQFLESHQVQ